MTTIYMLTNVVAILFLSPYRPLTLKFNAPIEYFSLGKKGEYDNYLSKNKKILVITPKKDQLLDDFVVVAGDKIYPFQVRRDDRGYHQVVQIKDSSAKKDLSFQQIKDGGNWSLGETTHYLRMHIKGEKAIMVNGISRSKGVYYFPLGAPVLVNGERIYN